MENSRRDLLNDVAEHRSILKKQQNTYYPVLVSYPERVKRIPKTGVLFLLCKF